MQTLTLEVPDELAERLRPYRDELTRILQAGLQRVEEGPAVEAETPRERLMRIWRENGISEPLDEAFVRRYVPDTDRVSPTVPIDVEGPPASEYIIQARGPRE